MRKKHEDSGELTIFDKLKIAIGDFWYNTKVDLHQLLHDPNKPKKVNNHKEKRKKKLMDFIFVWSVLIIPKKIGQNVELPVLCIREILWVWKLVSVL